MPKITVDHLAGSSLSSRAIEWFGLGRGGYSHAASVLADGRYLDARSEALKRVDPNCRVPEVVPAGVHIRDPKSEQWVRKRRATLEVTEEEYATWEANLRAKINDQYGRSDILDFIDSGEVHPSAHYICSALAINAVQHVSRVHWTPGRLGFVPYPLYIPAHQVTPDACLLILQTAGFTIESELTQIRGPFLP